MSSASSETLIASEIRSQPQIWRATLEGFARSSEALPFVPSYGRVLFTGCGSTYYLSLWAARHCQQMLGVQACAAPASELLLYRSAWLREGERTLLIAVSRSGKTTETVRAVEAFRAGGYGDVLAITCYAERALAQLADWVLSTPEAPEESIAQTRSFTSMMLAVAWLLDGSQPADVGAALATKGATLMETWGDTAAHLGGDLALQQFFFLGSGPQYGLACEAMLKMKEISLSYSEAYHFLEFRHGPMSMIDEHCLVVGLLGEEATDYELSVLRDMRQMGAHTLALAEANTRRMADVAETAIVLESGLPPHWRAPLYLPVLQWMAYHRALAKGLDPDHPRHLSPVIEIDE